MRHRRHRQRSGSIGLFLAVSWLATPWTAMAAEPAAPMRLGRAGNVEVAGREVRCDNVRTRLDRHLPNLGAAAPEARLMLLNPRLLARYSGAVQLFVFHHECGHTRVGESELEADCWAVGQGVRDGWLDRNGLAQVCRSFDNAPETDTHPSGKRRCANIDRCFAKAETEVAAQSRAKPSAAAEPKPAAPAAPATAATAAPSVALLPSAAPPVRTAKAAPKLLSAPRLVRSSVLR